jgi:high-affinity nickel-transport protein
MGAAMRRTSIGLLAGLVAANGLAWLWAWLAFAGQPVLMGTALLAWVFGLRHAVDADHIAAIDNSVRKLMQEGQRAAGVGAWFSLGHSTVVIFACAAIAAATAAMQGQMEAVKAVGGVVGTAVSGGFLLAVAAVNLVILAGVWRQFRAVRRGEAGPMTQLDPLIGGGLLARLFRPLFRAVRRSWHLYPIGVLFGLGFDTATEVGLLAISGAEAARGVSVWQVMVFPALFTAGMALVDTADSTLMVGAYGWAALDPLRKLWYNLTITAASVLVAVLIGGLELLGLIGDQLGLAGGVWAVVADLNDDMANFGFVVVALFALSWLVSAAIYRWRLA